VLADPIIKLNYLIMCHLFTRVAGLLIMFLWVFNINKTQAQCGTNLVANGDFSIGNVGFTSQYSYCNTVSCLIPEDRYAVGKNAHTYHFLFYGSDHTTNSITNSNNYDDNSNYILLGRKYRANG